MLPFFPVEWPVTVPSVVLLVLLLVSWFPVNTAGVVLLLPPSKERETEEHSNHLPRLCSVPGWEPKLLGNIPKPFLNYSGPCLFSSHLLNRPGLIVPLKPTRRLPPSGAAASHDIFPNLLDTQFPRSCTWAHHFRSPRPAFVSRTSLAYKSNLNELVLFSFRLISIPPLLWHLLLLRRVQVKEVTLSFLCLPGMRVLLPCFQVHAKSHKPLLPLRLLPVPFAQY